MSAVRGLVRTMRPHQWTKNVLVLAPLLPAGEGLLGADLWGVAAAFVAFCLASSGIYLVNDVRDVEADRAHPVKRDRPIAAGLVTPSAAVACAIAVLVAALLVAVWVSWSLAVVVLVYVMIQLAYCFGLKHEPVLELACVASGFLLRALAGGVGAGIELSQWFLLTAAFGSLYIAAGKRYAEARMGERTGGAVRRVVRRYSSTYLRFVWTLAATVVVTTYALWSFEVSEETRSVWSVVSVVPFVLAILRFGIDVDAGDAEEPDVLIVRDRVLLALGTVWVLTLVIAVYL